MELSCRFPNCQWLGMEEDIFHHVETIHKSYLREPEGKLYYDFTLSDLEQEVFVLCANEGLYWFCQNTTTSATPDAITFGIFHIGHSKRQKYTLKLGLKRDGFHQYWGRFKTQTEEPKQYEETYDLVFKYQFLTDIVDKMPSRKLRIYFGDFDDSDDVPFPAPKELMHKFEQLRHEYEDKLTCAVCLELIRQDARFCENNHYVCLHCFDKMLNRKKLKCPTCRGIYLYDCADDELERWLRLMASPESKNDGTESET